MSLAGSLKGRSLGGRTVGAGFRVPGAEAPAGCLGGCFRALLRVLSPDEVLV